jgi:hypothetical protein
MQYYGYFFLLLLLFGCQPKTEPQEQAWAQHPIIAQAQRYADSTQSMLPLLLAKRDSIGATNEFEALKIMNSHNMIEENLSRLTALLDSLKSPAAIQDFDVYKQQVQIQTDYLKALYLSSNAMLKENSLSLGTWDKAPAGVSDSILTPVGKQRQ